MKREVIILIGHGSTEKDLHSIDFVADNLHELIHQGCKDECIMVAFLQNQEPSVDKAIQHAVLGGAKKIIIHPFLLSSGIHVIQHIPQIVKNARDTYTDAEIICTAPLGGHQKLAEVVLERIREVTDLAG